jgi:hypothetical protein
VRYSILRREFLQPRNIGVCVNTRCRDFFEIDLTGQRSCDDIRSRQQRQRDYSQVQGKARRKTSLKQQTQVVKSGVPWPKNTSALVRDGDGDGLGKN